MAKKAAAEVGRGCFGRISLGNIRTLDFIRGYQLWVWSS